MDLHLAYLAQGKLWLKLGTGEAREVESKFGQSLRERAVQIQQRTAWKSKGRGAQFMSGGLLWGMAEQDATSMRVSITGIARGRRPGELLYALETEEIGGVFLVRDRGVEEQRLFHSAERRVQALSARPDQDLVACAVTHEKSGTANLAVMRAEWVRRHLANKIQRKARQRYLGKHGLMDWVVYRP